MCQSRKRLYILMFRADICSPVLAHNMPAIIQDVLPKSMYSDFGGVFIREHMKEIQALRKSFLTQMGRDPTMPDISQAWCRMGVGVGVWQSGLKTDRGWPGVAGGLPEGCRDTWDSFPTLSLGAPLLS